MSDHSDEFLKALDSPNREYIQLFHVNNFIPEGIPSPDKTIRERIDTDGRMITEVTKSIYQCDCGCYIDDIKKVINKCAVCGAPLCFRHGRISSNRGQPLCRAHSRAIKLCDGSVQIVGLWRYRGYLLGRCIGFFFKGIGFIIASLFKAIFIMLKFTFNVFVERVDYGEIRPAEINSQRAVPQGEGIRRIAIEPPQNPPPELGDASF